MPDLTPKQIEAMFAAVDYCNPTDIIQVVRCKDCKFNEYCSVQDYAMFKDDDYCSRGIRMDGD